MTRKIRAFSSLQLSEGNDELILDEDESHHLCKVLRVKVGSVVEVLDGMGTFADAEIAQLDKRATQVKILGRKSLPAPNAAGTSSLKLIELAPPTAMPLSCDPSPR